MKTIKTVAFLCLLAAMALPILARQAEDNGGPRDPNARVGSLTVCYNMLQQACGTP